MKRRYRVGTGGAGWSPDEDDLILDTALGEQSEPAFNGVCDRLAKELGRWREGAIIGHGPVRRRIWGLAVGMSEYRSGGGLRLSRTGPLTWAEVWVISVAAHGKSATRKITPDEEYIAKLLNRPVEVVRRKWDQLDSRRRAVGFGFS